MLSGAAAGAGSGGRADAAEWCGVVGSELVALREAGEEVEFALPLAPPLPLALPAPGKRRRSGEAAAAAGPAAKRRRRGAAASSAAADDDGAHAEAPDPAGGSTGEDARIAAARAALVDYFQLAVDTTTLCTAWAAADARMASIAAALPGMRIARQAPFECLISFICSSNNNIARITQMLLKLRVAYGVPLGSYRGATFHAFPSAEALATRATEAELRALGFGYRAKFVVATAAAVVAAGGESYLLALRGRPRADVQTALVAFAGVGRKVADCVALFSLDARDVIPVDTHVWAIACRYFDGSLRAAKSLTPSVYERVGDLFRGRYGEYAGWAHSWLFAAELPGFAEHLPAAVRAEMAAVRTEEAAAKAAARAAKAVARAARDAARAATASGGASASAIGKAGSAVSDTESEDR